MPQFNFQARFADAVESGAKRQTVRVVRKRTPRVGETAHLFTGLRQPGARVLGRHPITDVRPIFIDTFGVVTLAEATDPDAVYHGRQLADERLQPFVEADGFETIEEFLDWIEDAHGLPFQGHVTYWDPETNA